MLFINSNYKHTTQYRCINYAKYKKCISQMNKQVRRINEINKLHYKVVLINKMNK